MRFFMGTPSGFTVVFNEMAEGAFQFTMVAFRSADGEIKKWKGKVAPARRCN